MRSRRFDGSWRDQFSGAAANGRSMTSSAHTYSRKSGYRFFVHSSSFVEKKTSATINIIGQQEPIGMKRGSCLVFIEGGQLLRRNVERGLWGESFCSCATCLRIEYIETSDVFYLKGSSFIVGRMKKEFDVKSVGLFL